MDEPSGAELADRLRQLFPEMDHARFDEEVDGFGSPEGNVSACGVLSAFSWTFQRWLAAGEDEFHLMAAAEPRWTPR
jgi:hypothetical protein